VLPDGRIALSPYGSVRVEGVDFRIAHNRIVRHLRDRLGARRVMYDGPKLDWVWRGWYDVAYGVVVLPGPNVAIPLEESKPTRCGATMPHSR
jgi:hypothetical protein